MNFRHSRVKIFLTAFLLLSPLSSQAEVLSKKEIMICADAYKIGLVVMSARQDAVSRNEIEEATKKVPQTAQEGQIKLMNAFIEAAYNLPIQESIINKRHSVQEFGVYAAKSCFEIFNRIQVLDSKPPY